MTLAGATYSALLMSGTASAANSRTMADISNGAVGERSKFVSRDMGHTGLAEGGKYGEYAAPLLEEL